MDSVKILQIGMTRNIGGLETYLMSQWRNLKKVSYDFMNITGEYEIVFAEEIKTRGGKIFAVPSRHLSPFSHYFKWIKFLIKYAKDYEGIVLNSNNLLYVFPLFAAKFFGIKYRIFHSHNAGFEENLGFIKKCVLALNKILLNFSATHLFACTKLAGETVFKDKDFHVIHNAVDIEKLKFNLEDRKKIREELGIKDEFVLGHVGRFTYQKNHEFLIDVFNEVKKLEKNAKLILIGDSLDDKSFLENAKSKVENLNLKESVQFLGLREDTNKLFSAMDAFLFPSHFEGLGIVGIESQISGLPSFFSDTLPQDLNITPLAHFLPINNSNDAKLWAKEIVNQKNSERKDYSDLIKQAGYSVPDETKKIENFFLTGELL